MISEAELRRQAAEWGVDPMVVDLDYSLGWFVAAWYGANRLENRLYFKGGTCLRKCYFTGYRFSEDLDFTAMAHVASHHVLEWVECAIRWAREADGPDFQSAPPRLEVVRDEYGGEVYQARVYYRGPLRWGGDPRAIRLDITSQERVMLPAASRLLIHPYSDRDALSHVRIACYALPEILAEKVRALAGQRRFAISRDLYDIYCLVQAGVELSEVIPLLPPKFRSQGLDPSALRLEQVIDRRTFFEQDWRRRLAHLVQDTDTVTFEEAWSTTMVVLQEVEKGLTILGRGPSGSN